MRWVRILLAAAVLTGTAWAAWPDDAPPSGELTAALHAIVAPPASVAAAEAEATRACLRERGFDPPLPAQETYGTANLPGRPADTSGEPFARYADALGPDRRVAFDRALIDPASSRVSFTTPHGWAVRTFQGGCIAEARRRVYGSLADWLLVYALPQDLNGTAADTFDDPQIKSLWQRHLECVHESRSYATAEASCLAWTRLLDAYMAAFDRRSAPWLREHADLVRRAASALDRAARV